MLKMACAKNLIWYEDGRCSNTNMNAEFVRVTVLPFEHKTMGSPMSVCGGRHKILPWGLYAGAVEVIHYFQKLCCGGAYSPVSVHTKQTNTLHYLREKWERGALLDKIFFNILLSGSASHCAHQLCLQGALHIPSQNKCFGKKFPRNRGMSSETTALKYNLYMCWKCALLAFSSY